MQRNISGVLVFTGIILLIGVGVIGYLSIPDDNKPIEWEEQAEKGTPIETKIARSEYFHRLLRDPATGEIPRNIRARELEFAKTLPTREQIPWHQPIKSSAPGSGGSNQTQAFISSFTWNLTGPIDVGGRTRALGIDQRNSNIIIAGGTSGGMWKSTDGGTTWTMKTSLTQNMSVTWVTQDPNNPDTWYYASGEFRGNSPSDRGSRARYYGTGIFKSTDNGETWSRLPSTSDTNTSFDSPYDYISRIVVNPNSGDTLYISSNGFGIYRSIDAGSSWSNILGAPGNPGYNDVTASSNGFLAAALSELDVGSTSYTPGIYISNDGGDSWTNVTPSTFPSSYDRTYLAFAPSDSTVLYAYTQKGSGDNSNQGISFHHLKLNSSGSDTVSTADRSANLPNFGDPVGGVNTQSNYNMVLKVKPDDPNHVLVGATNLFRSFDGFATAPTDTDSDGIDDSSEKDEFWVGGYAKINNVSQYSSQHPDQHVMVYDPGNPDRLWAGHDGGLSVTSDITATSVSWSDADAGYITTQFYTAALPADSADDRVMGGTQDNGTPFFRVDNNDLHDLSKGASSNISSGDGSYAFFSPSYIFVSTQNGKIRRRDIDGSGNPTSTDFVHPSGATGQLFIHPYVVDPNDENVMYYPGGRDLWRNTNLGAISNSNSSGTSTNWNSISNIVPSGYEITTIAMPESPMNQVYFGASSTSSAPLVYKLDNARTNSSPTDITPSSLPSGAYVHDIEVNPQNGSEVIFVLSNYGVTAIYHTSDGGSNWTAVEGNLDANPGPSIRNAEIVNTAAGTVYLVGTSTGVYSTDALSGGSTTWVQEGSSTIGYTVTEYLESRDSDGNVLAATHGRGIFTGNLKLQSVPGSPVAPPNLALSTSNSIINLDWDASSSDVIRYRIYRGKDPNSLALHDSVSQTAFEDQSASFGSWFYRVTAVDVDLNESGFSDLVSAFQETKSLTPDWKLIGSPMISNGTIRLTSNVSLFGFVGAYQSVNSINPQKGVWGKSTTSSSQNVNYDGSAMISSTITVNQGWNLIGGIADTIQTTDINDPGGVLSATPIFEYDGSSYQSATEIRPSDGYWIHADQQGQIELALTITQTTPEAPGTRNTFYVTPTADAHWDEIRFTANGIEQSMYVAGVSLNPREKQPYLLPPQAPAAGLDVRTSDGYSLATEDKTEIDLTASAYPVRATLLQQGASGSRYRLVGLNNGEEIYYDLEPGKSVEITKSYSQLFLEIVSKQSKTLVNELFPNYPNPFNPATTIKYQLSEQAEVRLEVYDILGRRVGVLVNELQLPGEYTVNFDGSRLSSGTYFIQLRAGDFLKNQKMTLIK